MKTFAQLVSLPVQERQAYLHSLGIPSIESVYSRVAAEHAIPLPVAEAMVQTGVWMMTHISAVAQADQELNNGREEKLLTGNATKEFLRLWSNLAPALGLPRPQVLEAAGDALKSAIGLLDQIGDLTTKLVEEERRAEKGAACA